jgi:LmbE family N-acetylglucosaminyl deacetylase
MLGRWVGALLLMAGVSSYAAPLEPTAPNRDGLKTDLMMVVAHPDDESMGAATLARYADHGLTVACVYATRGEGGGNAVGTQGGAALGILREAELRRCLARLGVSFTYFLDRLDWAYTESAQATLEHWGHEETLGRLVRLIRALRPDVVVTILPAPSGGQHGHHQAAGLLATEAVDAAARADRFPEQLKAEGLEPWQVRKLYYMADSPRAVAVDTGETSSDGKRAYADIAAEALSNHRSQGWGVLTPGGRRGGTQHLSLARVAIPVAARERDLFEGLRGADGKPLNPPLVTVQAPYRVPVGSPVPVTLRFPGAAAAPELGLSGPAGWTLEPRPTTEAGSAAFTVTAPPEAARADAQGRPAEVLLAVSLKWPAGGTAEERTARGLVPMVALPPVTVEVEPLPAVSRYRDWCRANGVEAFTDALPADVPMTLGETTPLRLRVTNRGATPARGQARLSVPEGWPEPRGSLAYEVAAGGSVMLEPLQAVPADAEQRDYPISVSLGEGDLQARDTGRIQALPRLVIPRVAAPPALDGSAKGWPEGGGARIPSTNLVEGKVANDADSSAEVRTAYDDQALYVRVLVHDDSVVNNIAPNDIKGHWRSDSVEVAVDPTPASESTLTTFKLGIFPWDTAGHVRAARDADANPGPIEESAPGARIASRRTPDGYEVLAALPWKALGATPSSGKRLGFDVIVYDGDKKDAVVGDNINKSRIAWAFRPGVWGRPAQWGTAVLE